MIDSVQEVVFNLSIDLIQVVITSGVTESHVPIMEGFEMGKKKPDAPTQDEDDGNRVGPLPLAEIDAAVKSLERSLASLASSATIMRDAKPKLETVEIDGVKALARGVRTVRLVAQKVSLALLDAGD